MNPVIVALALFAPAAPPEPAPNVRENVRNGLQWLSGEQKKNGNWEGMNNFPTTTVTATAGLAMLMEGSTPASGTYSGHVKKAVAWFEKNAAKDGKLGSSDQNEQYQDVLIHAQALLFLACAYDLDDDTDRRERLHTVLDKAVAFALECQSERGGWGLVRQTPSGGGIDSYSTATMLHALSAARKAGIEVPKSATDKGLECLVRCTASDGGIMYSDPGRAKLGFTYGQPIYSAAAVNCALAADRRPAQTPMWARHGNRDAQAQLQFLRDNGGNVLPYQYQVARMAHALGETGHKRIQPEAELKDLIRWSAHRATIFKALKDTQQIGGSWADQFSGPQYSTALALIILQLDNEYLPAFAR